MRLLSSITTKGISYSRHRALWHVKSKTFSTRAIDDNNLHDANVQQSPFPSIQTNNSTPITEFVTAGWTKSNGKLKNKVAIIDGYTGQSRTFKQYHNDMGTIAANLKEDFGISHDSTVALFAPNTVDYVPICLATALCGAKLTPINPQYKVNELVPILNKSETTVLITHWSTVDVALEAMKDAKTVKHVVTIPEDDGLPVPEGTISLSSLKEHSNPLHDTNPSVFEDPANHPFLLPYSSGTTGLPKGVCLSHTNLVANLQQLEIIDSISFPPNHKLISPLPFFHIYGYLVSALYTAWQGQEIITMSGRFDLELFCQLVEKYQPQRAHLVPPILIGLAKHPVVDNYDLSSMLTIVSAAAPLAKETENAVIERVGCEIKQGWGMSELSPIGLFSSDYNIKSGSVGQLVPNTYGKVVDPETKKALGPGEPGELMIKGPQVMLGYLNEQEKTRECLDDDGWLRTGDISHYDEDGFFFITDRIKELIKVRGFQVAPAELEALLLTHPSIDDVAVIPVEDEMSGELPRAYVSVRKDELSQKLTEDEVKEWVKEKVAPHKRLAGGVEFIDQIPKSASGKILRRILREKYKEEVLQ